jgi:uncharacterized repeat protein (TIGR03803 family)
MMPSNKFSLRLTVMLWIAALTLLGTRATGQTESVLHTFDGTDGADGIFPRAGLVFDKAGNLYGTTFVGGLYRAGTVFELTPQAGGGWTETVLHNFSYLEGSANGPTAPLILDLGGNVYGTTTGGGAYGQGVIFELSPQAGGGWTYKRLHAFGNGKDGQLPQGGLVLDGAGNLYGTTAAGGAYGGGTVFKLAPAMGGVWTEKILHHFNRTYKVGWAQYGGLIFDSSGDLYGTTYNGGAYAISGVGGGTVFKLTPAVSGAWTYATIHEFGKGKKGAQRPAAGLTFDVAGNLYGTTVSGGTGACSGGCGTAFELTPTTSGGWIEKILHSFDNTPDGDAPLAPVILDAAGNVYGTTLNGGPFGLGSVFELKPLAGGGWQETILQNVTQPHGGLIFDGSGNLYGTTNNGGNGYGTVFEITP